MTGALTATSFSGSGLGLTSLNGSNITSGTVADAQIDSTIARDSEVTSAVNDEASTRAGADNSLSSRMDTAHNLDGSIQGAGYRAIGFKISYNVDDGTNVCDTPYIPAGFTVSDCGNAVQFIPIISSFSGDGAGTERFYVKFINGFELEICSDSKCANDGFWVPQEATILAIGGRPLIETRMDHPGP
jgi:hypothetical protein